MNAIVRAAETNVGNPTLNIAVFAIFVVVTLFIVIRASRRNATASAILRENQPASTGTSGFVSRIRTAIREWPL